MSVYSEEQRDTGTDLPSAAIVAAYLREHPKFFDDFPDVLRDLELSHASGDAVSLLERQVIGLREENARLKARFHELVALATSNDELIKRIHQLALMLMEAAGPRAIFTVLRESLARDFKAEHVRTLVFGTPSFEESDAPPEFVGRQCHERELFADVLQSAEPRCARLSEAQVKAVFGSDVRSGSAVLLPLSGKAWDGLLVVSSADPERFNTGMGTEFLAYLGDIASLVIDPWISRSRQV